MSDFSQLCPLFNAGVYSELCIANIGFSGISTTMNALAGARVRATNPASVKFQRTVVVTKVYVQKQVDSGTAPIIIAKRHASTGTAAGTAFASLLFSTTTTVNPVGRLRAMTTTAKTFLAADVLGFSAKTKKTNGGRYNFIVRYKEK